MNPVFGVFLAVCSVLICSADEDILYGSYFEGDIDGITEETIDDIIKEENKLFEMEQRGASDDVMSNAIRDQSKLWPDGRIPYVISNGYTRGDRERIRRAMEEYQEKTCVRFAPRTRRDQRYVHIQSLDGCHSLVGRSSYSGAQELSLRSPGCMKHGIIVHELMHVIGFYHEQARADRDEFVRILSRNVQNGRKSNFKSFDLRRITHLGAPYDYGSVMHYGPYAFSKNGQPTIVKRKDGPQIGQREGLSRWDVYKINKHYNCRSQPPPAPVTPRPEPPTFTFGPRPIPSTANIGYCRGRRFDKNSYVCCKGQISEGNFCCNNLGFDRSTHSCCKGVVSPGGYGFCCGKRAMNPETHVCCNGQIKKGHLCRSRTRTWKRVRNWKNS